MQFKWREPEETGGRDIHSYFLQMKPPAGDQQEIDLDEVTFLEAQAFVFMTFCDSGPHFSFTASV